MAAKKKGKRKHHKGGTKKVAKVAAPVHAEGVVVGRESSATVRERKRARIEARREQRAAADTAGLPG